VETGFPPLDETLGLLPGQHLTPRLCPEGTQGIVWLGAALPFGQVPALLVNFAGVTVSPETVRR
jgi:hypothetical protein